MSVFVYISIGVILLPLDRFSGTCSKSMHPLTVASIYCRPTVNFLLNDDDKRSFSTTYSVSTL